MKKPNEKFWREIRKYIFTFIMLVALIIMIISWEFSNRNYTLIETLAFTGLIFIGLILVELKLARIKS